MELNAKDIKCSKRNYKIIAKCKPRSNKNVQVQSLSGNLYDAACWSGTATEVNTCPLLTMFVLRQITSHTQKQSLRLHEVFGVILYVFFHTLYYQFLWTNCAEDLKNFALLLFCQNNSFLVINQRWYISDGDFRQYIRIMSHTNLTEKVFLIGVQTL